MVLYLSIQIKEKKGKIFLKGNLKIFMSSVLVLLTLGLEGPKIWPDRNTD